MHNCCTTEPIVGKSYDVVVLGAGAAGVAAATAAAKLGQRTLLVDSGAMPGGELISGMPVDGAINAHGEWVMGGVGRELFSECERLGGYIGPINDHRLIYYVAFDPEIMKIAVVNVLNRYGVELLLHTYACGVDGEDGRVRALFAFNKTGRIKIHARIYIDCSGDGDLAAWAGAPFRKGNDKGDLQPISLMFRLCGVDTAELLEFARRNPESLALGESVTIRGGRTDAELVESLYHQAQPAVFLKGGGPLLAEGMRTGKLFPTALIMIQPTSRERKEVCLNATRVANVDATNTAELSKTIGPLMDQVMQCAAFLKAQVPGFRQSAFAGVAPRLGIRETRRIVGDYSLSGEEVLAGKKTPQGVAKGCHHVDIHQDGTGQIRIPVADGGSYDIPWGCLVPKGLNNVLMAGRCASGDREAHSTMRVMGSCLSMGHAAGVAASLAGQGGSVREIPHLILQQALRKSGAILEGVY